MSTKNPILSTSVPKFNESSVLRSPRDADATQRQWLRNKIISGLTRSSGENIRMLQQQIDRLRKRGGSPAESTGMVHRGEWAADVVYQYQNVVSRGMLGTFIVLGDNPVVGVPPEAGAPSWFCMTSWPSVGAWA